MPFMRPIASGVAQRVQRARRARLQFVKLAEIVGIAHKKRGRKVFCEDVALGS
jgi:hypothetical protein